MLGAMSTPVAPAAPRRSGLAFVLAATLLWGVGCSEDVLVTSWVLTSLPIDAGLEAPDGGNPRSAAAELARQKAHARDAEKDDHARAGFRPPERKP